MALTPEPFTPTGVSNMQAQLNALSASDLQTQANLIKSDLVGWVSNNFTLDADQQTFLKKIDARFIEPAASLTGFAVENKLPIKLDVNGTRKTFKLIQLNPVDFVVGYSSNTGFSVMGSIVYTVTYS